MDSDFNELDSLSGSTTTDHSTSGSTGSLYEDKVSAANRQRRTHVVKVLSVHVFMFFPVKNDNSK